MLTIQNISVSYGDHQVLNGASLEVAPGTIHGVLGMNGAGKTTFFEAVYGRVPRLSGDCTFEGRPLQRPDAAFLETESFFYPMLTGREYLRLCAVSNPAFDIDGWNELFHLPLGHLAETYSSGMKQKLALMGALAPGRPILILDEPFNGIDLESSEILYQVLAHLCKQGRYILLSSHILETLTNTCHSISHLEGGRFIRTYSREEFAQMQAYIREKLKGRARGKLEGL
ncbi:MAG: ATP-binding cassette domain-containing protein [Phaeodactylibacter sp.]|nr:ATP-binding cassette domain-containing protein [Phaeodactylibacter sp.]